MENKSPTPSSSSLRWGILRDAFLARTRSSQPDNQSQIGLKRISRKTALGFNLLPCRFINKHIAEENLDSLPETNNQDFVTDDVYVAYTLPLDRAPTLVLRQRVENRVNLSDFEICNRYNIDNTGLVCNWPSEDVLAYFCLSHADMFRSKRILELGAGYGLAGLVIAATTDASEVVISDGNPQVVDYIQHNIHANSGAFTDTEVKSMILHWNQEQDSNFLNTFDIIVANNMKECDNADDYGSSDPDDIFALEWDPLSTFFKEFHEDLAHTVKSMLKPSEDSQAIFFSPKRGNSLDIFLEKIKEVGLHFNVSENYDNEVWLRHEKFLNGDKSWPNYEKDHCYPFLIRITL